MGHQGMTWGGGGGGGGGGEFHLLCVKGEGMGSPWAWCPPRRGERKGVIESTIRTRRLLWNASTCGSLGHFSTRVCTVISALSHACCEIRCPREWTSARRSKMLNTRKIWTLSRTTGISYQEIGGTYLSISLLTPPLLTLSPPHSLPSPVASPPT